jgi:hypothetical protein
MARLKNGALGRVSGKVGNVVGGNWKGIDYLRILPTNVTNPKTLLQNTQRLKFAVTLKFLQPVMDIIRMGYRGYEKKMSEYNAAFSNTYHNAITGEYPDFTVDYSAVLLTRGSLPGASDVQCTSPEPASLELNWSDNSASTGATGADSCLVVAVNPVKETAIFLTGIATRADATMQLPLPASWSGNQIHCYLSFISPGAQTANLNRKNRSTSSYAGSVTVS